MEGKKKDGLEVAIKAIVTLFALFLVAPCAFLIPTTFIGIAWTWVSTPLANAIGKTWPLEFGFWSAGAMAYILFTLAGVMRTSWKSLAKDE